MNAFGLPTKIKDHVHGLLATAIVSAARTGSNWSEAWFSLVCSRKKRWPCLTLLFSFGDNNLENQTSKELDHPSSTIAVSRAGAKKFF